MWNKEYDDFDADQEVDPEKDYKGWELEKMADALLKKDTKAELCNKCGKYGKLTGSDESMPQLDPEGNPQVDDAGNTLYVTFPELECKNGHRWYQGEGKSRGIKGENPILFEEHLRDRKKREIYTAIGTPDPSIQQGIYNRTHPQGRKMNSNEQRKKHGAAFYR